MPGRGPWHGARRTPLPGTAKGSHLRVVDDKRREDRHVGLENVGTVKVREQPHERCRRAVASGHPVKGCVKCRWLLGIDDAETRWFAFWVDHGEDR